MAVESLVGMILGLGCWRIYTALKDFSTCTSMVLPQPGGPTSIRPWAVVRAAVCNSTVFRNLLCHWNQRCFTSSHPDHHDPSQSPTFRVRTGARSRSTAYLLNLTESLFQHQFVCSVRATHQSISGSESETWSAWSAYPSAPVTSSGQMELIWKDTRHEWFHLLDQRNQSLRSCLALFKPPMSIKLTSCNVRRLSQHCPCCWGWANSMSVKFSTYQCTLCISPNWRMSDRPWWLGRSPGHTDVAQGTSLHLESRISWYLVHLASQARSRWSKVMRWRSPHLANNPVYHTTAAASIDLFSCFS